MAPTGDVLTLERATERWLATAVATARNAKGRRLAATRVARYLVPSLGACPLAGLTGDDLRRYRLLLERLRLKPLTVTHVLSDLRALLLWAVSERLITHSPFPRRLLPRVSEEPPRGFSADERNVLVRLPGERGFVLRLLLATGLRWGEACRACAEEVRKGVLVVAHGKSGRVRRVPLPPALLRELHGREGRLVRYAEGSPGSFARGVRRASGIAGFHVHRCRHTYAMRWLEAGGSLAVLQQLLGHRELTTTMRYARVTDDVVRRESARVERRLARGG